MVKSIHISTPTNRVNQDWYFFDFVMDVYFWHISAAKLQLMQTRSGASAIVEDAEIIEKILSSVGFIVQISNEKVSL